MGKTSIFRFINFVELVEEGDYTHDPSIEAMRQELQSGKSPSTLATYSKLSSVWKTGVVDGIVCSMTRSISQEEVESFNSFLQSLASAFGGIKIAPLRMFDASLDENLVESFRESRSKGVSKEVPFAIFPGDSSSKSDAFWANFDEDVASGRVIK